MSETTLRDGRNGGARMGDLRSGSGSREAGLPERTVDEQRLEIVNRDRSTEILKTALRYAADFGVRGEDPSITRLRAEVYLAFLTRGAPAA